MSGPRNPHRLVGWWTDRSLLTKSLVAVGIPAAALAIAAVAFFSVEAEARAAQESISYSLDVGAKIQRSLTLLVDAETGVRGYVLTGEQEFLEPYHAAAAELPGVFGNLERLIRDPGHVALLAGIRDLAEQRVALFPQVIASGPVGSGGLSTSQRMLLGEGRAIMDRLRTAIAGLQAAEDELLTQRRDRAAAAAESGRLIVATVLGGGLGGSVVAAMLLTSGVTRRVRRLGRNAELLAAGQPIILIPPAKDEVGRLATSLERASHLLTEREKALRRALDEATDLYENAPTGYHASDADNVIVRMNTTELRWLGYDRAEVIGRLHGIDLYTPESAERFRQLRATFLEEGVIADTELEMRRKDGSSFPVLTTASAIRDETGQVVGSRVSVIDIAARRAAERELAKSQVELERFFALSSDMFGVVNLDGTFRRLNAAWEPILGYSPDELIGQPFTDLVHPDDVDRTLAVFRRGAEEDTAVTRFDNRYRHRDGSYRWLDWTDRLVPGEEIHYSAARDVTDRKRVEAALESARREAEAANAAKSHFLSRMSHELRTPLNAILGFAQLLELDGLEGDKRESVDQILKGGRHLLDLINEVLDISRIETGQFALSLEPVNVGEIVADALSLIGPLGAENGVRLRSELPDGEWHILADRQRIRQVLLNLLGNAVKYSPSGATATVGVDRVAGRQIRITVEDSGPGIPPRLLPRLFVAFERIGAEASGVEGTGLGLVLSKALVQAMGGTIGVDSTVGVGSRFWVELRETVPVAARPEATADLDEEPATGGGRPGTILYVEDNLSNFRLVERVLERRGLVRLIPAMLGRLGLDLARDHRPNLILLDLHLPDMNGDEVLRELRADPTTREIPVVILSADVMPGHAERLRESGARAFLGKPIDVRQLLSLVDEFIPAGETVHA
jgi:PAS domain S-box-containing protein